MDTDNEALEEQKGEDLIEPIVAEEEEEELARIPSTTTVAWSSVAGVSLRDVKREELLVRRGGVSTNA